MSVTVTGVAEAGGGTFVKVAQVPPVNALLVWTVLVNPTMGVNVNWNPLALLVVVEVVSVVGRGLVTVKVAIELVMLPALLVMITV